MPDRASPEAGCLLVPEQRAPAADAVAQRAMERFNRTPFRQGELALAAVAEGGIADDDSALGPLALGLAATIRANDWPFVRAFRALLDAAARCRSPMLNEVRYVEAMARLATHWRAWRRHPCDWDHRACNGAAQFNRLVRHLLADYPVPAFFDAAWFNGDAGAEAERRWFVHVGTGHNLRTARGLPVPLTRAMAHHAMLAPADLSVFHALRWGQVRGLGGGAGLARAVIASRLRVPVVDEPFWLTVLQFLAAHPAIDPGQVGPLVDYLHDRRFEPRPARVVNGVAVADGRPPQPAFSMKGRTPAGLLRQVEAWHRALGRSTAGVRLRWESCGIGGFECVEGEPPDQRVFTVTELLDGHELREEGLSLAHCVGSYARWCARGRWAIFSLREDAGQGPKRRVTAEVVVPSRTVTQARGRYNRLPSPAEEHLLRAWAAAAGLTIAPYVFRL